MSFVVFLRQTSFQRALPPFKKVGKNGSGKSNFFAAIRFLLGDMLSNTAREDRARLLHVRRFLHFHSFHGRMNHSFLLLLAPQGGIWRERPVRLRGNHL